MRIGKVPARVTRRPLVLRSQQGLTYLALLFLVAIAGVLLAAQGSLYSMARQREREAELLFIGHQYRNALGAYYNNSPGAIKQFPKTLEDMLDDKRFAATRRELRRIYVDPFTNNKDWGFARLPTGEIYGVYSLATGTPIKRHGFRPEDSDLEDKDSYSKWVFVYSLNSLGQGATAPAAPGAPVTPGAPGTSAPTGPPGVNK